MEDKKAIQPMLIWEGQSFCGAHVGAFAHLQIMQELDYDLAIPHARASRTARSSSASSPPAQAINDSPAGQPATVPTGRFICGSPPIPAMQVSRITRTRKDSIASLLKSIGGAIDGAVGSATMVPGGTSARTWARPAATTLRAASA